MRRSLLLPCFVALLFALVPVARAQDDSKDPKKDDKPAKTDDKGKDDKGTTDKGAKKGDDKTDEDDGTPANIKLNFNPFAKCEVGDWVAFKGSVNFEGIMNQEVSGYWKVVTVEDDKVTIESGESGGMGGKSKGKKSTFSRKEPPTLDALLEMHGEKVKDLKSEDDKQKVDDKEFACQKITFNQTDAMGGKVKWNVWLSPEVKAVGIVRMLMSGKNAGPGGQKIKVKVELNVAGFGTATKTEWGKSFDEIKKANGPGGDDEGGDSDKPVKKKKDKTDKGDDKGDDAPKDTPKKD